jgi:hypothetical protein
MDKEYGRNAPETIDREFVETIVDHCITQASLQTPAEAIATIIKKPYGFNYFYPKNMIKLYYSFGKIDRIVSRYDDPRENEFPRAFDELNDELLSMIYIISLDTNLHYLFNLCFNFYNNTEDKEEEDLSKLLKNNPKYFKLLSIDDYLIVRIILINRFNSKNISMQKIMNSMKFPLYCAILVIGYWCKSLIEYMRYHLYPEVFDLFQKKISDLSSYNNDHIARKEYYLLEDLTLHKMDNEIETMLEYNDNGIFIIDDKINYTLEQLVSNYNQIHAMITGRITEKLKQCVNNEFRAYYSDKDIMDVSNKILFKIGNNICIQCKIMKPIFCEAQSAKNNDKNKFCTKICQMKFYNYII